MSTKTASTSTPRRLSKFAFPVAHKIPLTEMQQRIETTFSKMGYPNLRNIKCFCDDQGLTLTGRTETFYLKQIAQVIAAKVSGVEEINNLIEVNNV